MINISTRAAVVALAMTMPVAIQAQRGTGPGGGRAGGNPVAPLIDMRRELNLSSRQLTQLDSIERTLLQRNHGLRERMRTRLDSLRPRSRQSSEAEIAAFRAESDSMRALRNVVVRNDSVARVAAMGVLTDSQRVRVRERLAERRGFAAGRMSTMRGGQRGMRQGRQGMEGPRMRQGRPGGRMGMGGAPPRGRIGGPDGFAPRRFEDRRGLPDDSIGPGRRFRGMNPPDGVGPDGQGFAPRRRPMIDGTPMAPRFRRPPADSGR
jgi:Spy/CpxP family protein refolding chaperone